MTTRGNGRRGITMGKSRGERRVIFSSSGATHTTSESHLRRVLAGTAARAAKTPLDSGAETPRAPGAKRHHADAMGRGQESLRVRCFRLGALLGGGRRGREVGMEFGFPLRVVWSSCGAYYAATGGSPRPPSSDTSRSGPVCS